MTNKTSKTQKSKNVTVNDRMQRGYRYELSEPVGRNFDPSFRPELTPSQMLYLGVFCGKYFTDSQAEFPRSWFKRAKLSATRVCSLNYFVSMPANPFPNGEEKDGYARTTRAVG